jgi:hypothetical protein
MTHPESDKMKRQALQTSLFGDLPRPVSKPEPSLLEKDFMQDVQRLAASLCLPSIHVETFHQNSFMVQCPVCGNSTLATCRKAVNKHLANWPDLIIPKACIETKRTGYEPTPQQAAKHERLRRQGVPVLVVSQSNVGEAIKFLKGLKL